MALIQCPECKKEVSDTVQTCVHCGYLFRAEEPEAESKKQRERKPLSKAVKLAIAGGGVVTVMLLIGVTINQIHQNNQQKQYQYASDLFQAQHYEEAIAAFSVLNDYQDAKARVQASQTEIDTRDAYQAAMRLFEEGHYEQARDAFLALADYQDSQQRLAQCQQEIETKQTYDEAQALFTQGEYEKALALFTQIGDYLDAKAQVQLCQTEIREAYHLLFSDTVLLISVEDVLVGAVCAATTDAWYGAISNGYDFSKAIDRLHELMEEKDLLAPIMKQKKRIDRMMPALKNPPEGYDKAYDMLVDMYGDYVDLYDLAISPQGSLVTFSQTVQQLMKDFRKKYEQLLVLIPQLETTMAERSDEVLAGRF